MASLATDRNGTRRILFVDADGKRRTVRLGRIDRRTAEGIRRHVEALLAAKLSGQPVPRDTARWLAEIGDVLHDRLARVGLVAPRRNQAAVTLGAFLDEHLEQRARELKPGTMLVLGQAARHLRRYFGDDRPLASITPQDADRYRAWLRERGIAPATVAKWCRLARQFLNVACRWQIIERNPFEHIRTTAPPSRERRVFVPGELVQRVIDVAPDPQWKLLIALARWGGLRIPSEALRLTWADVDFERRRFIVRSSKTEHHESAGVRVVPMFPELVEHFLAVFEQAEPGSRYVIARYRSRAANLRTQFVRYIEAAGLKPWPKPWQNLRASRATELADLYPSHVCAAWLGHSERIADAFYRQVTDEHFRKATAEPTCARGAESGAADARKASQGVASRLGGSSARRAVATDCDKLRSDTDLRTGRGRIRTCEGLRQRVYSPSPLATRAHAQTRRQRRPANRPDYIASAVAVHLSA